MMTRNATARTFQSQCRHLPPAAQRRDDLLRSPSHADMFTSLFQRAKSSSFSCAISAAFTSHHDGCCRDGPSEYQGLMNALKRKIDDGSRDTNSEINELRKEMKQETLELKQELKELLTKLTADHEKQVQELQGQVAEMLQIIRSRP